MPMVGCILEQNAMRTWGEPIDEEDITEMMKVAEVGGDGKIDYMGEANKLCCSLVTWLDETCWILGT